MKDYQKPESIEIRCEAHPFALSFGAGTPTVGDNGNGDFENINDNDEIDW